MNILVKTNGIEALKLYDRISINCKPKYIGNDKIKNRFQLKASPGHDVLGMWGSSSIAARFGMSCQELYLHRGNGICFKIILEKHHVWLMS